MSGKRLLVIDDSPTIRKLVELSFSSSSWLVEFASSGGQGIEKARARPPDAILLDFVLPDMRGTDVCHGLAADPATAKTPVIVMSAKHESVRYLFEPFAAVAAVIGKPFAANEIVGRFDALLNRAESSSAEGKEDSRDGGLSFEQKQAVAQALYAKLRNKFALIPQLMSELDGAPAAFFARKLLTPQLVDELLDALRPSFEQRAAAPEQAARVVPPVPSIAPATSAAFAFEGTLGPVPVVDLLRVIAAQAPTSPGCEGALSLTYSDCEVALTLRAGSVVFAAGNDPRSCSCVDGALAELAPDLVAKAVLHATESSSVAFAWRPGPVAGPVNAFAVPIPLADLELSILRVKDVPPDASFRAAHFSRGEDFSRKIVDFSLSEGERQLLAAVDERQALADIAERAELPAEETAGTASRLVRVGLLRRHDGGPRREGLGPLLVADPDISSFVEPLRKLLSESTTPVRVVDVPADARLYAAIRSESPRMVIVNASVAATEALQTAAVVRSDRTLSQPRLVAVLDVPAPDEAGRLATAGYNAVLTKPIRRADLERLLFGQAG